MRRYLDRNLDFIERNYPQLLAQVEKLRQPEARRRLLQNVRVKVCGRESQNVLNAMWARGVAILVNLAPKKSFIISSNPVIKITQPGITDIRDSRVEVWLPISHDVVVGLGTGEGSVTLYTAQNGETLRRLNSLWARQSSSFAARCPQLVASLAGLKRR